MTPPRPVTMSPMDDAYALIRRAIAERKQVHARFDGHPRQLCPTRSAGTTAVPAPSASNSAATAAAACLQAATGAASPSSA